MNYFAYGSNMSARRLAARCPTARKTGTGMLREHQLRFHKIGFRDGSGKCDIFETGVPEHKVYGILYQIEPKDKKTLDITEGLNKGYKQKEVDIKLNDNSIIRCFTYYATKIDDTLQPFDWYLEHVLRGAKENQLPKEYMDFLDTIESIKDRDKERRETELVIYR